jgi:uncharacterized protein (TIGR04255 family)
LYWARIRDAFPTCEHAIPLSPGNEPEWVEPAIGGLPLPRVWFISSDKQGLIQLQGDCFYFNWRRIAEEDVYPRYGSVMGKFKQHLTGFLGFLDENKINGPAVTGCELTYVNHIPQDQGWKSPGDVSFVFKDFCWRPDEKRFLPEPRNVSWNVQFSLPAGGTLNSSLALATRIRDKMPTLKFEMNAKVRFKDKNLDDVWEWFQAAHEWIVCGFVDLTQEEIQRNVWKKIDA